MDDFLAMLVREVSDGTLADFLTRPGLDPLPPDETIRRLLASIRAGEFPTQARLPELSQMEWYGYQESLGVAVEAASRALRASHRKPTPMPDADRETAISNLLLSSLYLHLTFGAMIASPDCDGATLFAVSAVALDVRTQIAALSFLEELRDNEGEIGEGGSRLDDARLMAVGLALRLVAEHHSSMEMYVDNPPMHPLLLGLVDRLRRDARKMLLLLDEIDGMLAESGYKPRASRRRSRRDARRRDRGAPQ